MRPVSERRRRRDANYPDARRYVFTRARGMCESRYHSNDCSGRAECVHHIAGRTGPDPHHPDNLVALSDACHRWTHANPEQARRLGLMRSRLGMVTPPRWADDEGEAYGGTA